MYSILGSRVSTHPFLIDTHRPTSSPESWVMWRNGKPATGLSHPSKRPILMVFRKLQTMNCVCYVVTVVMPRSQFQTGAFVSYLDSSPGQDRVRSGL